ncbi:MAG: PBSX family phage terminase large subunit, partial [Treponema sp.]|nr:PBSX family phage terminase large subunit [Treponema sp.]
DDFRLIMNHAYTEFTEAGGRGSCKSSFISVCVIVLIIQYTDFNAVVLRKTANTLRDSVFSQLKWACDKLGVSHLFSFSLAPLQAVYKPTGQIIFFRGCDDPLKLKSIKPVEGYIAITWFEELAEFTEKDVMTVKLSTMRGGSTFYVFNSFNPPSSVRNWCNDDIRHDKTNRFVHVSSYLTVPKDWLGEAFLFEANEMKRNNERAYRNIFLGEPTGTGVNIFENVELREITDNEIKSFEWIYYGLDFGYYPDCWLWLALSYDTKNKILYIFDELKLLKHGNWEASEALKKHHPTMSDRITADSAEPKSIADYRQWGWNMRGAIKGKGSLDTGMKWLQQRTKIVIDSKRCPESADEFTLYEYEIDKKTGEILSGFPQGQADHAIAAARYALEEVWLKRGL